MSTWRDEVATTIRCPAQDMLKTFPGSRIIAARLLPCDAQRRERLNRVPCTISEPAVQICTRLLPLAFASVVAKAGASHKEVFRLRKPWWDRCWQMPCHLKSNGYLGYSGVPAAHCAVPGPRGEQPTLGQPLHAAHASPMLPHSRLLPRKEVVPAGHHPGLVIDMCPRPRGNPCSCISGCGTLHLVTRA